jgi:pyruvate,water dikinase
MAAIEAQTSPLAPARPDIPVIWEHPEHERLIWVQLGAVFPHPVAPMTGSLHTEAFTPSANRAANTYAEPWQARFRRINTYMYQALVQEPASPTDPVAQGSDGQERVEAAMARLGDWWEHELLPEIKEHLAFWEHFDLGGAPLPALLAHLEETVARLKRLWEIELLLAWPHVTAVSMFEEFYRDLFGAETALDAYRLLQGFDNKTLETDRALWRLSRTARATPEVRAVLEGQATAGVMLALEGPATSSSPGARAFLQELGAFLHVYGRRDYTLRELHVPSWLEDPTPAIKNLQDYSARADRDPEADLAALAAERERLIARARERLQGYPRPVPARFEFLLKAAQEANVIAEDHNFWLDCRALYQVRQVLLECGRRLAASGVIERPDDVFYLTLDELRATARRLPRGDWRKAVVERRAEMEYFRAIQPPPVLGTPPPGPPPAETPISRAFGKFFGEAPRQEADPHIVVGNAGSPGVARGPARVIRTLDEADRLHSGDVLVTRSTAPAWTPLFATAAAIVTDAGGILSHCAVVAREYRLPAVVGTGTATTSIRDGQLVEVDGSNGVVRIII